MDQIIKIFEVSRSFIIFSKTIYFFKKPHKPTPSLLTMQLPTYNSMAVTISFRHQPRHEQNAIASKEIK
jgi:hypothetical protein